MILFVRMIPSLLLSGVSCMGQKTLIMSGVRIIQSSVRIIILYMQDGQLSQLEQNSHILLIIIGVFSMLVILLALLRHCWRKRNIAGVSQRQIQTRTGCGTVRGDCLESHVLLMFSSLLNIRCFL